MSDLNVRVSPEETTMFITRGDQTVFSLPCLNTLHMYVCEYFTERVLENDPTWNSEELKHIYYPNKEKT